MFQKFCMALLAMFICASAMAMNNDFFQKMYWNANGKKRVATINQFLGAGKEVNLIIGRRTINDESVHEPLSTDDNVIWVYADVGYEASTNFNPAGNSLPLWINFDSQEQIQLLPRAVFTNVYFDWSVLHFFKNIEMVLQEIHYLLKIGGKLILSAGEQGGMHRPCKLFRTACEFEYEIPVNGYPTCVNLCQCDAKFATAQEAIRKQQKIFLDTIFGEANVLLHYGFYPPAPKNKDGERYYFSATKTK